MDKTGWTPLPHSDEDLERARSVPDTPQTRASTYRLAWNDEDFMTRRELRPVRLQLELLKPEMILAERGIRSTVILFGGARIPEPGGEAWDKVPSKFDGWGSLEFEKAGFRAVPSAVVRRSAYVAPGAVLMPSFVNVGAYVDSGTMVDTWASVGSCAQIGKNVHLSGGVGIGGVLEPMQAGPTIIEDNCFIGARSEVVEGCVVREGSVLGMGVFIGKSTKIVDRATGEVFYGEVPANSVVVAGSLPGKPLPNGEPGPSLYCAVIVKRVDAQTRSKTSINELLRD